ncbi:MAG: hypothetical protein ACLFS4_03305, partial [Opitutales bacterium]
FGLRERATRAGDAFYLRHAYPARDPLSSPAIVNTTVIYPAGRSTLVRRNVRFAELTLHQA